MGFAASAAQRVKVRREGCRLSGVSAEGAVVDPAHVVDRSLGGCDDPLCVVGLRRDLHEAYDRHELDLLPFLTLAEQAHAAGHLGLARAFRRVTGGRVEPVPERGSASLIPWT